MSSQNHAKVLIAGGSIAGLTLANILERIGIDYLVLEKYGAIAPDLGASIGIFQNGFRILDQLGCYDAINALVEGVDGFENVGIRNEHGQLIQISEQASQHFTQRLAYAPIFVDRQMIIQVLYDNLRDKSKVLTGKGVNQVEQVSGGVQVRMIDGSVFTGEILVGADGIHSTVRREMWRLADQAHPGYFPLSDRTNAPTEYCCIFGISKHNDKFPKYSSHNVMGQDHSYLIARGPNHRIYWFLFKKLPSTVHGLYDKIPRYTEAERDALAAEHANDPLTEQLRFGELYANRTTATLQALPEVVFSKWHYGRITTIGDAAHKFNPIGGQGGNSAIEDAAVLSNHLFKLAKSGGKDFDFSDANIASAFELTHSLRHDRANILLKKSHDTQSMQAMENFAMKIMAKYIIPRSSADSVLEMLSVSIRPAARLNMFDVPRRQHVELYYDERPAKPIDSKIPRFFAYGAFLLLSGLALVKVQGPMDRLMPETFLGLQPKSFTGLQPVDAIFGTIVRGFANSISWNDAGHTLQFLYLLAFLVPIFLIWYIEGNRHGNRGSIISRPGIFGLAMHLHGIGLIAPLSFLLSIWSTGGSQSTIGRHIPEAVAKAIVPSIFLGYVLPTVLLFVPAIPSIYKQDLIMAWLFAAIVISFLVAALAKIFSQHEPALSKFENYSICDVPHLVIAYKFSFAFSLVYHVASFAFILLATGPPELSFSRLFFHHQNLSEQFHESHQAGMFMFLKLNFLYAFVGVVLYGIYSVYELRSKGLITTKQAVAASGIFLVAQPLVGPGAAIVGLWWWREVRLASARSDEGKPMLK